MTDDKNTKKNPADHIGYVGWSPHEDAYQAARTWLFLCRAVMVAVALLLIGAFAWWLL